jgi:polar amino acid transport system permease protein
MMTSHATSDDSREAAEPASADEPTVVPVRHWGRWVAGAILLIIAASLIRSFATNPNLQPHVIGHYLFAAPILRGVRVTIELTVLGMLIGVAGGIVLALMRLSGNPVLTSIGWTYVWLFRASPILVQLLFWGYLGAFYSKLSLTIPFTSVTLASTSTSSLITPFVAALLGLGLNEAAYAAETIRAGLLSVDEGQTLAAKALGFSSALTMRVVVLPQAMRVIIPPLGNATIIMLKTSALVSVIGGLDLLTRTQNIYAQNFEVIPLLMVATLWYLALTTVLSLGQRYLERRFARGSSAVQRERRWSFGQQQG